MAIREDGFSILEKTISFKTPSTTVDFVLDGSVNGWTAWKDADSKTLDGRYRR